MGLPKKGSNVLKHAGTSLLDGVYAVVESAVPEVDEAEVNMSELFKPYNQLVGNLVNDRVARIYELADTEAFLKPVAMIPDIGGPAN